MSTPSFATEGSQLSRKIYFVKKKQIKENKLNRHNFFQMTSLHDLNQSEISDSRGITTLQTSQSKQAIDNPEKQIHLPIITQSKYNFRPSVGNDWVKKHDLHPCEPKYKKDRENSDMRNIKRLRVLQNIWKKQSFTRHGESVVDKSLEKAQKYIKSHNRSIVQNKNTIEFEKLLRNRDKDEEKKIEEKGVISRQIKGLKGKGGSVRSLFEELYSVQQVYKIDK